MQKIEDIKRYYKIVVMDDNPAELDLIESHCESLGLEVKLIDVHRKLLKQMQGVACDYLLIDMNMGSMNCFDILKEYREVAKKVFIMSGMKSLDVSDAEVDGFVLKDDIKSFLCQISLQISK